MDCIERWHLGKDFEVHTLTSSDSRQAESGRPVAANCNKDSSQVMKMKYKTRYIMH